MRASQEPVITVGVGKTHLATALGHIAIRRRLTVQMARAEKLFTRLRAARLDNTLDAEFRRLTRLDLLIIDDFALRPLGMRHHHRRLLRTGRGKAQEGGHDLDQ